MPKPARRRVSQADINRELRDPALILAPRGFRRAYVSLLRSLEDVAPWHGEN